MHYLLPLLTFTTTALALTLPPHPVSKRDYCTPTTRLPWSISHFTTFTTNHTTTPERNSSISFTFTDANNGVSVFCDRTSSSSSIVDADNFYPCGGSEVQYLYYGDGITIREGVECGNETLMATGSSVVNLVCGQGDGRIECVVEGEVEVPFRLG